MLLAGGILQHGYQCGMIWGAVLAAGARAWHLHGTGPGTEQAAIQAGRKLVELFRDQNSHINCLEITDIDKSSSAWKSIKYFLIKGGTIGCIYRASRYARAAFEGINHDLVNAGNGAPKPPVSCAAVLARKMGASELQATMASGFAGGIGLSGGACGALGAAIWMIAMNSMREHDGKLSFNNAGASDAMEKFVKCTDYKFECSSIVGRHFENVNEHADYVRDGGCSELIETLAGVG